MPLISYEFPRVPGGDDLISRGFAINFPGDWFSLAETAPLPVLLLLHGNGQDATEFMDVVEVVRLWDGSWYFPISASMGLGNESGTKIKAIVVAPQAVSFQGPGGDWNSGHFNPETRNGRIEDLEFVFDALERANRALLEQFHTEYAPQLNPAAPPQIVDVLDRDRVLIIGYAEGGEMAFRVAYESKVGAWGWNVAALGVVATSIGGWNTMTNFLNNVPATADWTPSSGLVPSAFVSVMQIHGINDVQVPYEEMFGLDRTNPVVAAATEATVAEQIGVLGVADDFERADFTAVGTRLKLFDVAEADFPNTLVAGAPILDALPATISTETNEWSNVAGQKAALYAYYHDTVDVDAHVYPNSVVGGFNATTHIVDFFQRFGGL